VCLPHDRLPDGAISWRIVEYKIGGPTGLAPATPYVTVLRPRRLTTIQSECERHEKAMFKRVWCVFRPLPMSLSDTERSSPTWVGMAGLRHKRRHKHWRPGKLSTDWWAQNFAQRRFGAAPSRRSGRSVATPHAPNRETSRHQNRHRRFEGNQVRMNDVPRSVLTSWPCLRPY